MSNQRTAKKSRRDSNSPDNDAQPAPLNKGDGGLTAVNDSSLRLPQAVPQMLPVPPATVIPVDPDALTVWMSGQLVGNLLLNHPVDLTNAFVPPGHRLAVDLGRPQLIFAPSQPASHVDTTQTTSTKRKVPDISPSKPNKRPRRVAKNAPPIAPKPVSAYAKAVEEPSGMTKIEEDSCLTCIRNNRRCGGTELHMVNGAKRCQNCACPGTNTSGRVCYWPDKEKGILTYEDGVRVLGKKLGGRTLAKNTRKGRLERQRDTADEPSVSDKLGDDSGPRDT